MSMKLAVLFSGGKDSHLAMYKASLEHEIVCAITVKSQNDFSYMFQSLGSQYTSLQLEAQNIAQHIVDTKGEKEIELNDLKRGIKEVVNTYGVEGVVTGAIESTYQASRIQNICKELDIWCFNPLWDINHDEMIEEITHHFEGIILGVFAYPLDKRFIGASTNKDTFQILSKYGKKHQISAIGEGGEFESFILNGPMYNYPLKITINEVKEEGVNCVYVSSFEITKDKH